MVGVRSPSATRSRLCPLMARRGAEKPRRLRHQQRECRPNPPRAMAPIGLVRRLRHPFAENMDDYKATTCSQVAAALPLANRNLTTPIFQRQGAHLHRPLSYKLEETRGGRVHVDHSPPCPGQLSLELCAIRGAANSRI